MSSHRWEVAFGLRTIRVNRSHAPNEYPDTSAAAVIPDLHGLTRLLNAPNA